MLKILIILVFTCLASCASQSQIKANENLSGFVPIWLSEDKILVDKYLVSLSGSIEPFNSHQEYQDLTPIPSPNGLHLLWFDNNKQLTITSLDNSLISTKTIPNLTQSDKIQNFIAWLNNDIIYIHQIDENDYSTSCSYLNVSKNEIHVIKDRSCPESAFAHLFKLEGLNNGNFLLYSAAEGFQAIDFVTISANATLQANKTLLLNSPAPSQARIVKNNPPQVLLKFPCKLDLQSEPVECSANSENNFYKWFPESGILKHSKNSNLEANAAISPNGQNSAWVNNNNLCISSSTNSKCIPIVD